MQLEEKVIACYNETADYYAAQFLNELSKKHFDRFVLREFASINKHKGIMVDLGCGPGQTTGFLSDNGVKNLLGIDISTKMINIAQQHFPTIKFEMGNLLRLSHKENYFGSAIAFYAIVHFTYNQVREAFKEVYRVLKPQAHFLFSFHVGTESIHLTRFLEKEVEIDFYFFEISRIKELLENTGFQIIDVLERDPYKDVEYASKRAYIWVEKK